MEGLPSLPRYLALPLFVDCDGGGRKQITF